MPLAQLPGFLGIPSLRRSNAAPVFLTAPFLIEWLRLASLTPPLAMALSLPLVGFRRWSLFGRLSQAEGGHSGGVGALLDVGGLSAQPMPQICVASGEEWVWDLRSVEMQGRSEWNDPY